MTVTEFNGRVIESVFYRRLAPFLTILAILIAVVAAVGTYSNNQAITHANTVRIKDQQKNAVTSCENGNESRAATRALWNYMLTLPRGGDQKPDEQATAFLADLLEWINKVYEPRDCSDLSRKYPLPPPPSVPTGLGQ